jgi:hypothetical protein
VRDGSKDLMVVEVVKWRVASSPPRHQQGDEALLMVILHDHNRNQEQVMQVE